MTQKEKYQSIRREFEQYLTETHKVNDYDYSDGGRWGFSIKCPNKTYFEVAYTNKDVCGCIYANDPHHDKKMEFEKELNIKLEEITNKYFN